MCGSRQVYSNILIGIKKLNGPSASVLNSSPVWSIATCTRPEIRNMRPLQFYPVAFSIFFISIVRLPKQFARKLGEERHCESKIHCRKQKTYSQDPAKGSKVSVYCTLVRKKTFSFTLSCCFPALYCFKFFVFFLSTSSGIGEFCRFLYQGQA